MNQARPDPVFTLLGVRGLATNTMPPVREPILHTLGYYEHAGGHGTIASDWGIFLQFMQAHWK